MSPPPPTGQWPAHLPAVQVRHARPTARLADIIEFYGAVLGLPELHRNTDGDWSVVMFGLPGEHHHLEFVAHRDGIGDGIDGTAPTRENLLVFYFDSTAGQQAVADRCRRSGARAVTPDNPWWGRHGAVAFLDPDGWTIVLMPAPIRLVGGAHQTSAEMRTDQ
ncbi:extradiol dioxygenase [Mycolicibacillus koreensis]|nr:extradiol dioxygenase [Mycolicibacillus koreensis]